VLNLYNKDFILRPHDRGNGENTVLFLKHLQALNPDKKLIILWDGARYHDGKEVKKYLDEVNEGIIEEKD
jgi:transposase